MKQTLLIYFLFILSLTVQATECIDKFFQEDKVNLYLCQNYSNYNETTTLLFKARTKILNNYINDKIRSGKLIDKKFQVKIYDPLLTYTHLELTQGKGGYFVNVSGLPTIEQLFIFVDYFTKLDWKPFIASDNKNLNSEDLSKKIDKFYLDNSTTDLKIITPTRFPVWSQNDLHLDYHYDDLKYFVDSTLLTIKATSSLPVKIGDRFILFQSDTIYVLQGREIINKIKVQTPISTDYDIYTFNRWVNICQGGEENWVYSYSYDKNRFYKRLDTPN